MSGLFALLLLPVAAQAVTGEQWIVVNGGSMSPTFEVGDIIVVDDHRTPETGDVVTIRRPDASLVTHRVIDINADSSLVLRGDANTVADSEAVPRDAVVGTVTASIHRPWSTALRAATSPAGRITLVALILFLLIAPTILARTPAVDDTERDRSGAPLEQPASDATTPRP